MFIVILSRNASLYSTDSLVRAAIKRGHHVRVVDHMLCDLVINKGKPSVYYNGEPLEGVDAVIPRIGSSATRYGASVVRQFLNMGVFSCLGPHALQVSRDKMHCMQVLAANGIEVPSSMILNNTFYIGEMLEKFGDFPKVIKLLSGTHGLGVILSENKKNAEAILESYSKLRAKALVQEFIEEAKGADIRAFVVDQKIVACMKRQARPGEFRSNLHRGATAELVRLTDNEKLAALKSVRLMGLKVAGVDMLRSNNGPVVLEVNASPGLEGIETTTNIDIASKIVQFIEREA